MGLVQQQGGRGLVDLARLDPDQAVFDMIDPADAVLAGKLAELVDQGDAVELAAVQIATGLPRSNVISTSSGSSGASRGSTVH